MPISRRRFRYSPSWCGTDSPDDESPPVSSPVSFAVNGNLSLFSCQWMPQGGLIAVLKYLLTGSDQIRTVHSQCLAADRWSELERHGVSVFSDFGAGLLRNIAQAIAPTR